MRKGMHRRTVLRRVSVGVAKGVVGYKDVWRE